MPECTGGIELFNYNISKFCMPKETWIGINSIEKIGPVLKKKGIEKCLLVTDKFMESSVVGQRIMEILAQHSIKVSVYSGVTPNPTMEEITEGVSQFFRDDCNAIVSLGGGSPHDCAKGIKYSILKGKINGLVKVCFAAVNTTAGTASEITRFAVVTDSETHRKLTLVDEEIIPDVAIDDPTLMTDMPPGLTAATGMDAMTHAVEAYVAKGGNYLTGNSALSAVRLIDEYLVKAYKEGDDIEARNGMVYAQYMAGMAFSNAGLGIVHAIAHQLGGMYNLPHGVCNAVLLPYGISYNIEGGCYGYADISKFIGLCSQSMTERLAATRLIDYTAKLNEKLNMPKSLKELKVKLEDIDKLAEMALEDLSLKKNPVAADKKSIAALLTKAFNGTLK